MGRGLLREHFTGICAKRLSVVETDHEKSNQHEFNGTNALKQLLGEAEPRTFSSRFLYLEDDAEPVEAWDDLTWYDARRAHPIRSEYRLYYPSNSASDATTEGDLLILAQLKSGEFLTLFARAGSTIGNQLIWLFGLPTDLGQQFFFETLPTAEQSEFAARLVLDSLGVEIEEQQTDLDRILARFGNSFPKTREFSAFARETAPGIKDFDTPDHLILSWMDHEERLFRQLEKHLVSERLLQGFASDTEVDVDGFISFSLSVQNRRKSRVGHAFENHLEELLRHLGIPHTRGPVTERREKPDFIFPGIDEYRSPTFPAEKLHMLGVKTTCKDRWRQVLTEADRIEHKHLITLEPGISEHQTNQMRAASLQLVVPEPLQQSYNSKQQAWLYSLGEFLELVSRKE